MSKTVSHVELVKGNKNRTPWGQRTRKGIRFPCDNPDQLKYFRNSGRYEVIDRIVRDRKGAPPASAARDTIGQTSRTGPGVSVITPERMLALANMPVRTNMSKKRLVAIAADLGVPGVDARKPPSNAQLCKQIMERQAEVIAGQGGGDAEADEAPTSDE